MLSSYIFNLQFIISICLVSGIISFIRNLWDAVCGAAKLGGIILKVQSRPKRRSSSPSILISNTPGRHSLSSAAKLLINSLLRKRQSVWVNTGFCQFALSRNSWPTYSAGDENCGLLLCYLSRNCHLAAQFFILAGAVQAHDILATAALQFPAGPQLLEHLSLVQTKWHPTLCSYRQKSLMRYGHTHPLMFNAKPNAWLEGGNLAAM